jgi:3-oxoacyl-[acyl-carrier protein] reductase
MSVEGKEGLARERRAAMGLKGLANRAAVVTGGAAGIGLATARRFAAEGARVAIWDVVKEAGRAAADHISKAGGEAFFSRVDVTDSAAVERGFEEAVARWGSLSFLVNNAGVLRDAQLVRWKDGAAAGRMEEEAFDRVVSVNLKGVFLCGRAAAPHLIRAGGGAILNASSVVGLYGNFGQTNYVATKAGVIGMTRTWARELGRYRIRVNAVAPGFIGTEMVRAMPEKALAAMVERTPLGRLGTPEEIAAAYAWLASDEASFVSGAVLSVDGGVVPGT